MVRTPWGACSPKNFFWRWVRLLSRYRLPKGAKWPKMAIFTNKRNFFPRDDLKHSKNQSGPKWPHLSIFSLKFPCNWRSGPPGCGYVSSKFVGGPEMCFYCKIRNFYILMVHFFFLIHQKNVGKLIPGRKSTLGSLQGDKTGKTNEKRSKINFLGRFSRFVAPEWAQSTLTPRNRFAHVFLMNLKKKSTKKM